MCDNIERWWDLITYVKTVKELITVNTVPESCRTTLGTLKIDIKHKNIIIIITEIPIIENSSITEEIPLKSIDFPEEPSLLRVIQVITHRESRIIRIKSLK